jgi:hypothetical protein
MGPSYEVKSGFNFIILLLLNKTLYVVIEFKCHIHPTCKVHNKDIICKWRITTYGHEVFMDLCKHMW